MISFTSYVIENVDGYYAIELDPKSQLELKKHGQHEVKSSKHITIAYKPSESVSGVLNSMLGRSFSISTSRYVSDDRIDAVIVDVNGLERQMPGPAHITISHKKGVMPAYANDMIKRPDFHEKLNLKLRGKLRYFRHN